MAMNGLAPKRALRVVASTILRPADLSRARETGHEIDRARHCGLTIGSAGLEAATYPVSGTWGYDSSPDPGGDRIAKDAIPSRLPATGGSRPVARRRPTIATCRSSAPARRLSGRRPVLQRHAKRQGGLHASRHRSRSHRDQARDGRRNIQATYLQLKCAFRSLLVARKRKTWMLDTRAYTRPGSDGTRYRACTTMAGFSYSVANSVPKYCGHKQP